ncbi:hypothetical protein Nepgr_029065 [Nepenthes gracilis]|uniref:Uncharacterized protein n=1 Tax=Nepenthes gracilis TaxID=150966 RepID=A0AAD3Y2N6_NEPGR|nr:hypothetical protein Nepgr_029065 [Nepenthes gracilis]
MIKRRFYRNEHGKRDDASDSFSSSSSDCDLEAQTDDASESEAADHQRIPQSEPDAPLCASSSGYESEDSSADDVDGDSPGFINGNDIGLKIDRQKLTNAQLSSKEDGGIAKTSTGNVGRCSLKCKSVFKCRLCPKIICLNEETLRAHLKSRRHARSEKLLNDGRLKCVLNSDGEEVLLEEDGETHAERHARIISLVQEEPKRKSRGRQRQRQRLKRKKGGNNAQIHEQETESSAKRRKNVESHGKSY